MTVYYVSSIIGADKNAGTSASAPLATLQAAANLVKPGDTVEVMNGTYTGPFNGSVLNITKSGTATAPITFEAAPGATPVIDSSGTWNGINIQASYVVVSGFTVVGDAANYTLSTALADYNSGDPALNGNGIAINPSSSVPLPNHITIENNTVYNEPGGGIYTEGADYVQILNNTVDNNAHWAVFGNSGISVSTSKNLDTQSGVHISVSGNLVFGNSQLVPTDGQSKATDGEGIILDTNPGYTGQIMVQGNTVYNNGGPGIESFLTANATITGNTVYGNNTEKTQAASDGAIFINQSSNNTVTNNVTTAPGSMPKVTAISESPSTGHLGAGNVVNVTLAMSSIVTVAGGTPTLALNDGGTATYTGGSGTNTLTFSYTVAAGQNTASLAATAVNLNGATVKDASGNAASLSFSGLAQSGPQIDTTPGSVSSVVASGTGITAGTGDLGVGKVVILTLNLNEVVTVAGGTPALTLNDGGTATYTGGSGTTALTFSYTVAAGQNTPDLAVTKINPNSATIKDGSGNAANLGGAVTTPSGTLQIDTTTPTVASVAASGTGISAGSGTLGVGGVVTLTVNLNEAVTVAGGTPTLALNDGGTATYAGGSGTNALAFKYTVAAGQSTADLAVTTINLNSASVKDGAGNAANLAGVVTNPSGTLQIGATAPSASVVSSVVASGTGITAGSGDLKAGSVVTLAVNLSKAVTVTGGTPTLALNDGGTATLTGGNGTNALTFSYSVAAGQNTSDLAIAAVNLNGATVTDGAGNGADLTGAVTNPSGTLRVDTSAHLPTIVIEAFGVTALDQVGNNFFLNPVSGGTGPELKYGGSPATVDQIAGWTFIGAERTSSGYEVALKVNGSNQYSVVNTDSNGNITSTVLNGVSGSNSALEALEASFHQDLNGDGIILVSGSGSSIGTNSLVVGNGATVEITGAYSGTVSFAGATGTLEVDHAASFTGKVAGQLAVGDTIDLADVSSGSKATVAYSGNKSPGTLTVSDGTDTAHIALLGNYTLANFTASGDGHGGTSIVAPLVSGSTTPNSSLDASLSQRMVLFSQHISSAFPSSGFGEGTPSPMSSSQVVSHLSHLARSIVSQHQQA